MRFLVPRSSNAKGAPTARPIPAWGAAPWTEQQTVRGLKARPIANMDVVRHATHPIAFAIDVSGNRSEVGVERGGHRCVETRCAILRAEDEVHEQERER
jgi:hypothetical protein